jgi:hypothetical protein
MKIKINRNQRDKRVTAILPRFRSNVVQQTLFHLYDIRELWPRCAPYAARTRNLFTQNLAIPLRPSFQALTRPTFVFFYKNNIFILSLFYPLSIAFAQNARRFDITVPLLYWWCIKKCRKYHKIYGIRYQIVYPQTNTKT